MTNDELDLVLDVAEHFWVQLSKLVARELDKVPAHLDGELLLRLQEKCSVYGTNYEVYRRGGHK